MGADAIAFLGLTGGIGAGKSAALETLARLGAATLSTDAVVHELYGRADVRDAVIDRFGESVLSAGAIDRSSVAERVFASGEDRSWLEQLLWPRVGQRVAQWRAEVARTAPAPRAGVVEVPLLFESGMESGFDATITVVADEEVRARRAAIRGHRAVDERLARQLTQAEKARRATYVVTNDGTLEQLADQLSTILDNLCR